MASTKTDTKQKRATTRRSSKADGAPVTGIALVENAQQIELVRTHGNLFAEMARIFSEVDTLVASANVIGARAISLCPVTTDEMQARAAEVVREFADVEKQVAVIVKPIKQRIDAVKALVLEREKRTVQAGGAVARLRSEMSLFEVEAARKRRKAQADAEAAAAALAVEDALADAIRMDALGKATGDEHYSRVADQILEAPVRPAMVPAPVRSATPGVMFKNVIEVAITDVDAFLAAIGKKEIAMDANTRRRIAEGALMWLRAEASQRGDAFAIPGVTRTERPNVNVRR